MFTKQNFGETAEFRSDTFTLPSDALREATLNVQCGENFYGTDQPTQELQTYMAQLFGKERGLFLPSTSMANLISVMLHSRGQSTIVGQ